MTSGRSRAPAGYAGSWVPVSSSETARRLSGTCQNDACGIFERLVQAGRALPSIAGMDLHQGFARHGASRRRASSPRSSTKSIGCPGIQAIRHALAAAVEARSGPAGPRRRLRDRARDPAAWPTAHPRGARHRARRATPELLEIARRRPRANLTYVEADLTALELPERSFDVIRTERVLMYLPDNASTRWSGCCGPAGRSRSSSSTTARRCWPRQRYRRDGSARGHRPARRASAAVGGRRLPRLLKDRGFTERHRRALIVRGLRARVARHRATRRCTTSIAT